MTLEVQEPRAETEAGWALRMNASETPSCACGCGTKITLKARHRSDGAPQYAHGHHPNPIRRAFAKLRAEGYLLLGEVCERLGVSETGFRRMEKAGLIASPRRVEAWKGRSVRVFCADDIKRIEEVLAGRK